MNGAYYEDADCTIYHGDALDILQKITPGTVHAVVTDPPYIIGALSAGTLSSKSGGWADMMNSATWFTAWYRMAAATLKNTGCFWSFLNWRTLPVVMRAASDASLPITSLAVWDKEWIGPGGPQGLRPSYEMVALLAKPEFRIPDRGVADVIRHKVGGHKPNGHPAEKPPGVVRRILSVSALPSDATVLDPFLGSGTTSVAARSLGFKSIGIEAEEKWCEVAAERLSQGDLFTEGVS